MAPNRSSSSRMAGTKTTGRTRPGRCRRRCGGGARPPPPAVPPDPGKAHRSDNWTRGASWAPVPPTVAPGGAEQSRPRSSRSSVRHVRRSYVLDGESARSSRASGETCGFGVGTKPVPPSRDTPLCGSGSATPGGRERPTQAIAPPRSWSGAGASGGAVSWKGVQRLGVRGAMTSPYCHYVSARCAVLKRR